MTQHRRHILYPLGIVGMVLCLQPVAWGREYYVDCSAPYNGDGRGSNQASYAGESGTAWNALTGPNATTFSPGDFILFNRGTTCSGELQTLGSGVSGRPITIDSYGVGKRPVLDGGSSEAVVRLTDQSHWRIQNLEVNRGIKYGILIEVKAAHSISDFRLRNLDVHGATGTAKWRTDSGEVVFQTTTTGENQTISDVVINGVAAHDSKVSEGIMINAGDYASPIAARGKNLIVENCSASHLFGDGIFVGEANHVVLQGNVVHDSGECKQCGGSTPVGLWAWNSSDVVVQNNESYSNHSWGSDGGGLDIDIWNTNSVVQYNYSHDNQSYCVAVFANKGFPTTNSIVRYNICSNNNRNTNLKQVQLPGGMGAIDLYTTDDGSTLDGVQVYNNTVYWNPATTIAPVFWGPLVKFSGRNPNIFRNNLVYSPASEQMIDLNGTVALDHNVYYTGTGTTSWKYKGKSYSSFAQYQGGSGQDLHSVNVRLAQGPSARQRSEGAPIARLSLPWNRLAIDEGTTLCAGIAMCSGTSEDLFKEPKPLDGKNGRGTPRSPTRMSFELPMATGRTFSMPMQPGHIVLLSFVKAMPDSTASNSRAQMEIVRSMLTQYRESGVTVVLVDESSPTIAVTGANDLINAMYDLDLTEIPLLRDNQHMLMKRVSATSCPTTLLISSNGEVLQRWNHLALSGELAKAIQDLVGGPMVDNHQSPNRNSQAQQTVIIH